APGLIPGAGTLDSGRASMVLRFDGPQTLELTGTTTGGNDLGGMRAPVQGLRDLPASTDLAVGLSGGADAVREAAKTARAGPDLPLGLRFPDDLAVLLGSNIVVGVDAHAGDDSAAARITTDPDRAQAVLDRLRRNARSQGEADVSGLLVRRTDDGVLVANSGS